VRNNRGRNITYFDPDGIAIHRRGRI
jgi:hypothetical protein